MKYTTLNAISEVGLSRFPATYKKAENINDANAILVRSAKMQDFVFDKKLEAIARAGAGVNNIPCDRCAEEGIVVFNTPGANSNGVKELLILGLILAARDAKGGMNWVDNNLTNENLAKDMESIKANFAGIEIQGKTLGVIGLGAIGVKVANTAIALGMKVIGYDPFISVNAAINLNQSVILENNLNNIYPVVDFITYHVPENNDTRGMINANAISQMKDGVAILNFARDGLVNNDDLKAGLDSGKIKKYVTDVPNYTVVNFKNVIAFPHLGATTEESEINCAIMAVDELVDFLENGNITNSVNYPNCSLGKATKSCRICAFHKNVPNVINSITALLGSAKLNICDMVSKSRGNYAYAMFDIDGSVDDNILTKLTEITDVIRIKVIKK